MIWLKLTKRLRKLYFRKKAFSDIKKKNYPIKISINEDIMIINLNLTNQTIKLT